MRAFDRCGVRAEFAALLTGPLQLHFAGMTKNQTVRLVGFALFAVGAVLFAYACRRQRRLRAEVRAAEWVRAYRTGGAAGQLRANPSAGRSARGRTGASAGGRTGGYAWPDTYSGHAGGRAVAPESAGRAAYRS